MKLLFNESALENLELFLTAINRTANYPNL